MPRVEASDEQIRLAEILKTLEAAAERKRYRTIDFYIPNAKQREFHDAGAVFPERMLRAGNQQGKTHGGGAEFVYHLTGQYPPWWQGHRWTRPIRAWMCGVKSTDVRDIQQTKLFGQAGVEDALGTGLVPRETILHRTLSHGAGGAFDTVQIKHVHGVSTVKAKSYEEGRTGHQGEPVDLIWDDEEVPMEIFGEHQARTIATSGKIFVTLTPEKGRTALILYFEDASNAQARLIKMGLNDADHLTAEQKEAALAKYRNADDRLARLYGEPTLGEGRVFVTPEADLRWPGSLASVPVEWGKLWGIDFGINHPFGAVLGAWDRDLDTLYILHSIRMTDETPLRHVPAMRAVASEVPVAWPHDGHNRDKGSGEELSTQYRNPAPGMPGLAMLRTHATFPDGGYSPEAAVIDMDDRMQTGRFKVLSPGNEIWFEEYRNYHREKGLLVRQGDDLMSATMKIIMMKRYVRAVPLGGGPGIVRRSRPTQAPPIDPWTGRPVMVA